MGTIGETPRRAVLVELVDDSPTGRRQFASAFRAWTGSTRNLRVLFTPDVLISVDTRAARGYFYDDGWSIECWIERGSYGFEAELLKHFPKSTTVAYSTMVDPTDRSSLEGLLDLGIRYGHAFDDVKDLI